MGDCACSCRWPHNHVHLDSTNRTQWVINFLKRGHEVERDTFGGILDGAIGRHMCGYDKNTLYTFTIFLKNERENPVLNLVCCETRTHSLYKMARLS